MSKSSSKDNTTIVQEPHPVLRKHADPVPDSFFGTPELEKIIQDMTTALYREFDGVAIAAPQIGISYRIFIVRGSIFSRAKRNAKPTEDKIFINPVFIKKSKKTKIFKGEGCLSVRWKYGNTERSEKVTVSAKNEQGATFEIETSGFLAQVFQHEIDHLNGVLFIDHATHIHEMSPEEVAKYNHPA